VVANLVSPAFDFQCLPEAHQLQAGRLHRATDCAGAYPFALWEGGAAHFVNIIGATMGPIFGVMMVDHYLIRKGTLNVDALYHEHGEFRFQSGWHVNALIAAGIGLVFSSILPNFTNLLPSWWGVHGWFFGVPISGAIYYGLHAGSVGAVPKTA
jgi:NCS1 family nucleobase:cation symporter-1